MLAVTFRFYGQLNDFLPPRCRQRGFRRMLAASASVKDAIEALGVPHPEVDVILVNGRSEDFANRLSDGDRVSVYPAFRSIDLAGLHRAGADPPRPARFVLDVHLRKLAFLLRLCGFDALLEADDPDVAAISAHEARIALTRDVGLLKRSAILHGHWVRHTDPELQLTEVLERFDLVHRMKPFARCLRCNTPLVSVDAAAVTDRLPPRTRTSFHQFRQCSGCGRLYWEGSHYARLARLIERVRLRLMTPRPVGE